MSITLPTEPIPAVLDLTANNILITSDHGIGKSGLLASTGYLLADPEDKLKAYPDQYRVPLLSWQDHKDFVTQISKKPAGSYAGIGLDTLNVSYTQCLSWVMKNVKFGNVYLNHPSESPQTAWFRVTYEFTEWLRSVTLLGYHVIATCHVNLAEVTDKKGSRYNRWIPAFPGGSSDSTYGNVLRIFSIVGFLTLDEVDKEAVSKPSTKMVMGKALPDIRADASRIEEQRLARVVYFRQDPLWLSKNKDGGFPDRVVLTEHWQDDWNVLKAAWGADSHTVADEPIPLNVEQTAVPAGAKAAGIK